MQLAQQLMDGPLCRVWPYGTKERVARFIETNTAETLADYKQVLDLSSKLVKDYLEVKTMWDGDSYDLVRGKTIEQTLLPRTLELRAAIAELKKDNR